MAKKVDIFLCFSISCVICTAVFLIIYFSVDHVARPRVPQFQVDSFSISNFTATPKVSFAADVLLTARNTDGHQAITSSRVDAGVYYRSSSLVGTTVLPPFSLGEKGQGPLTVSFPALAGNFAERDQSVVFDLKMSFFVGFQKHGWIKSKSISVEVFCADLLVPIPSNAGRPGGGFIDGPRPCRAWAR